MSPHIKKMLTDMTKKEEEKLLVPDKKAKDGAKKDSDVKTPNKPSAKTSDASSVSDEGDDSARKAEEELRQLEFVKSLERLTKENFNMVCYGIPDIYLTS